MRNYIFRGFHALADNEVSLMKKMRLHLLL